MKRFYSFQEDAMTAVERSEQSKKDAIERMKQRAQAAKERAAADSDRESMKQDILRDLRK